MMKRCSVIFFLLLTVSCAVPGAPPEKPYSGSFSREDVSIASDKSKASPLQRQTHDDYLKAARAARERKDYAGQKAILEDALRYYPESSALWKENVLYYLNTDSDPLPVRKKEILKSAMNAFEIDPSKTNAADLGWVYQEVIGDCFSALFFYEKAAIEYASRNPKLYYHMAKCYEDAGFPEKALAYYRLFIQKAPDDEDAEIARNHLKELGK